ncbi:MAG TPA: quinoprotein dehydrogenase-associated SoxYZ-like carrier [Burkholderiales bacterium]|nr:quinoprotein dehydrogenase-associated SoxYZ-like carrier [Burkholderiales bacterium]
MQIQHSKAWRLWVGAMLAFAIDAHAADASGEAKQAEVWRLVRQSLFGDRSIAEDGQDVLSLRAPARAQDASTVPVSISALIAQTPDRYVHRLYLIIDANPSPVAAIFTLTADSGRADIETRVRVEDYTWMRAVAEMSDGQLFMAKRYVKAAGGCSAPYGTAPDFDAFRPRVKVKLDASVAPGKPTLAQLMIQHPNSSGLARDQMTQLYIPAYFVRSIEVTYAGKPVMSAQVDFSISENPNVRFYFVPREAGELKVVAVDTKDRQIEGAVQVEVADEVKK